MGSSQIKLWDESLSDIYFVYEMSCRVYNKSKSNPSEYYGTDKPLFKKFKEVLKEYDNIISGTTDTKEKEIIHTQKCIKINSVLENMFESLYTSDLLKFKHDCIKNNKSFICVLKFADEGTFWSPLNWTGYWLSKIPHIKIEER